MLRTQVAGTSGDMLAYNDHMAHRGTLAPAVEQSALQMLAEHYHRNLMLAECQRRLHGGG